MRHYLIRPFWLALGFLTRLPVPGFCAAPGELGRATSFFPLVGGLIGSLLVGVNYGADFLWHSSAVSSALVIVAGVLITGALHLDGLMDVCDGVFGGRTPARALEIMKDSRVGAFGALGAVCLLLLKFAFLLALPAHLKWPALLLAPIAGRWALVYATVCFPYARPAGTGHAFHDQTHPGHLIIASLLAAAIFAALYPLYLPFFVLFVFLAAYLPAKYLSAKLAGLTGDTYGAINEFVELALLAALPLITRMHL